MYIGIEIETSWCSSGIGSLESLISGSDSWLSDADNWFSNDNVWFMQTEEDHIPTLVNKSDTDIIIITPTLRTAKDEDYTVEITITGGQSQVEDKGVGKHYTVAFEGGAELGETIVNTAYNTTVVTAIIPASETSRTITLTVVNNTVLEFDRTITVVAPLFGKKSFTIVDDNANSLGVVNAVTAGLVANDEDSAQANKEVFDAIIAAFKATEGYDKNTDQGIIYIPNGTSSVGFSSASRSLTVPLINWDCSYLV